MPEAIAKFAGLAGDTVHEAVNDLFIHRAPEEIRRDPQERPHNQKSVEFVDEILSRQEPVRRMQTFGEALRGFRPAYVEQPGEQESYEGRHYGRAEGRGDQFAATGVRFGGTRGFTRGEERLHKTIEVIEAAHQMRRRPPAAHEREHAKGYEGREHDGRRFMRVCFLRVKTRRAVKGQEEKPEHIKSC